MTRRPVKLPPIPCAIYHALGPIPVTLVEDLKDDDGSSIFGYWDPIAREIQLRKGMAPVTAWLTLWHERTHAELAELGVALSEAQEESICNAIAQARVSEMLARK